MTARNENKGNRLKLAAYWVVYPLLLALTFCSLTGSAGAKASPPVSARVASAHGVSVIAQWNGTLTSPQRQALTALQASIMRPLPLIHAGAVRLPACNLAKLKALPFVHHVSPDLQCRRSDEYTVGASGADVAFTEYGLTGLGITVAVLDSGIQWGRIDLQNQVLGGANFADDGVTDTDLCGHGTHVAGIIAGSGAASTGPSFFQTFYGIAPQTKLVNVRVLDANGSGSVSNVIAGLGWVVAHKSQYGGIRVINLSLGHPVGESYTTDPLCQAVEAAWKAGIVVVCAAGNAGRAKPTQIAGTDNEGYGTAWGSIQSPGNDPSVITVGAMKSMDDDRDDDMITTYSSRGPSRLDLVMKPDIVAPGNRIVSVNANNSYIDLNYGALDLVGISEYSTLTKVPTNTYLRLSGTSMAAPVVSGAAALLLQAAPALSPDTVKARLMISADKANYGSGEQGDTDPDTYGAGYLDIPAALQCSYTTTQPALSPTLSRGPWGLVYINTPTILANGTNGSGIWGTGLDHPADVWGSSLIWGDSTVAGSSLIWGDSILTASSLIWGDAVWTSSLIWGDSTTESDLGATALIGDSDALGQGPLDFLSAPPVPMPSQ